MRIAQILPAFAYGDAVGNEVQAISKILAEKGYVSEIYAEYIDNRLPSGMAEEINKMPKLQDNDLLIYHASTGSKLNYSLPHFGGKQVVRYHNITPPSFFHGYNSEAETNMRYGYEGIKFLSQHAQYCIADSNYNRNDLIRMGYTCPIDVCPVLINFVDYNQKPDMHILRQYDDNRSINILFVGRVAPNKKYEDVIRAFYAYQKYYNPDSRLFLVGNAGGMEKYKARLDSYIAQLNISDKVLFSGHIKFNGILSYYQIADLFLCMSEHEGFCVPLVEAMYFHVPIIAYQSTAVPDTLGRGGLLLQNKDPKIVATAMNHLINDHDLQSGFYEGQKKQLECFNQDVVKNQMMNCILKVIKG